MNNLKLLLLVGSLTALLWGWVPLRNVSANQPDLTLSKPDLADVGQDLLAWTGEPIRLRQSAHELALTTSGRTIRLSLADLNGKFHLPLPVGKLTLHLTPQHPLDLFVRYDSASDTVIIDADSDIELTSVDLTSALQIIGQDAIRVSGPIHVAGHLTAAGRTFDLDPAGTLTAASASLRTTETLSLRSGRLAIDGDLTLRSDDRLIVRDDEARPLVVNAGGNLRLQAGQTIDIVALDHPDSALISGGDMRLAAPNPVRGDVHYFSGGAFAIEQPGGRAGHLISPNDPIVLADGDVALGDYTGASLHVLAGGSVTLGNVTITGPDTGPNTINPGNTNTFNGVDPIGSLAPVILSSGTVGVVNGSITPTLDIRAGIDWTTFAGGAPGSQTIPPVINPTFSAATSAAITVTGVISMAAAESLVLLTNRYRANGLSGDITTGDINAGVTQTQTNGGSVAVDSRGDITVGDVSTAADVAGLLVTAGNAGRIGLLALNGAIATTGNLSAFSRTPPNSSGSAGNGGFIVVAAANDITIANGAGFVQSFAVSNATGSAGDGGDIGLVTFNGDINTGPINSYAFAINDEPAGDAGDVLIRADGGAITIGNSFFAAINASSLGDPPGDGGTVTATANGDLTITGAIRTNVSGANGDAGDINLFSATGEITTGDLIAAAESSDNVPGSGGNVIVESLAGPITTGDVFGYSNAFFLNNDARDGGDILMKALGDITTGDLENYSQARGAQGDAGAGGIISLESQGGGITSSGNMLAFSLSALNNNASATAQDGGDVVLQAANSISVSGRIEAYSQSGIFGGGVVTATATNGGTIALSTTTGAITIGGNLNSYASADLDAGNGGAVTLIAATGIRLNNGSGLINAFSRSEEGSVGNGGPVTLTTTAGDISLGAVNSQANNTFADSPTGSGGDISLITNGGGIDLSGNLFGALQSNATGSGLIGNSGDISLIATQGIAIANGGISAFANGTDGNGGDIQLLTTGGDISLNGRVDAFARQGNSSPGSAGTITMQTLQGNITTEAISAYSLALFINNAAHNGGAISLQAPNGDIATGLIDSYSEARGLLGDTGDGGPVEISAGGSITIGGHMATYALTSINNNNSGRAGSGGDIRLQTAGDLLITDSLRTFSAATGPNGQATAAGAVTLTAGGDIELTWIDARAPGVAANGRGGVVDITTGQLLRASGTVSNSLFNLPSDATIATEGLPNTSAITITHGGGGIIPFMVGSAATNGTLNRLTTGDVSLDPPQSFLFDHFEPPNIWILSVPVPELTIAKTADPASDAPYRGEISYTVTISNLGVVPADAVVFTDTLPAEVTFDRFIVEPGGSAVTPGPPDQISWSGSIPAGDAAVFSYVVNHTGDYSQVFSNTAEFFYPTSGQTGSASATVSIAGPPELAIAKSAVPDTDVAYQDEITYTIVLSNTGPSDAENTQLTDLLPVSTTFARWVTQPVGADVVNDELTWEGTVPGNGAVTFVFVVEHIGDYSDVFTNTAEFSHPTTEQTGSASATVSIAGPPDLAIAKSAIPDTDVAYQGEITYTVVLSNGTASEAENTQLTDLLPVNTTFVRWVTQPVGADVVNDELTWEGTVPGNGAVTFVFVVEHIGDYSDVFTNTAEFIYPTTEQSGSASATVTIAGPPELSIAKSAVPNTEVTYRGEVTYTVVVSNGANSAAENTLLTDTLPLSTTFARWVVQPVEADVINDVVTWNGTVPGNGAVTFSFVVSHTGDYEDVVTNTVEYRHVAGSGSAEAAFTVERWLADLLIAKSSVRDEAAGRIVYTIVAQNLGPGDAAGSVVEDPIPAGLSAFVWQCTPSGGANCTPTGSGPINDTLTSFPPGGQVTYIVTATLVATDATVINQATIVPVAGLTDTAPDNSAIDISQPFGRAFLPILLRDFALGPDLIVDELAVTATEVSVTIKNIGTEAVIDGFWVDLYLDPDPPPTQVNQRWEDVGAEGLVWGVAGPAILPGQSVTLTLNHPAYDPTRSHVTLPIPPGTPVYAQVDSINLLTDFGGVLELHELANGPYNNILGPVLSSAGQATPAAIAGETKTTRRSGPMPVR
ncbi:MAG: DUF11 domain-containing protein [Anaerolineae bacterium]|nr:DUF11 domain-containing protein [Anaerolineae bacterium]